MAQPTFFVRDFMSERLVTLDPDATVGEAMGLLDEHGVHELPVMTNSTLRGWISHHDLLRHGGVPPQTKVSHVMVQPPRVNKDADVVEAAVLMINNNRRALPVVDGRGKLVGLLSRTDVLRALPNYANLANLRLDAVMNTTLDTCTEDEPVDRAVSRLRDHNVGQLLVVNGDGRLTGHAPLDELLRAHTLEHSPTGASRPRQNSAHGRGEKRVPGVTVQAFVRQTPKLRAEAKLADAANLMLKQGTHFVAVVDEDDRAVGVVSRSNIVERVAGLQAKPGVLCQIVGLSDYADSGTLDAIYGMAQRTLQKIATEVRTEFLTLHYKVYKAKNEGDSKYSLSVHLSTEGKFFVTKADAWNPGDATKQALDVLENRVLDLKERRLEKRKGPPRRSANFYTASQA